MSLIAYATTFYDIYDGTANAGTTTSSTDIAPYCQEGIATNKDSPTGILSWTPVTEAWIAFDFRMPEVYWTDGSIISVYDNSGGALFRIYKYDPDSNIRCDYYDGAAWNTFSSTWRPMNTRLRIDIRILINGTTGAIEVYDNGSLHASYSGDTIGTSGRTGVGSLGIGALNPRLDPNGGRGRYSGIMVTDGRPTQNMRYIQTKPAANGTYNDWTGDYTSIDELGFDDSDTISTQTNGHRSTFTAGTLTTDFDSGYVVVGTGVTARAFNGSVDSPLGNIRLITRSNATDGEGAQQAISTTKQGFQEIFTTDPGTGLGWTVADAKAAEFGIKGET